MRRTLLASLGAALALCIWAGTAAADTGSAVATTPSGQTAEGGDPTLDAFGLVSQHVPEFGSATEPAATPDDATAASEAAPEAVPEEAAGTSQANGAIGGSLAANGNETGQTVDQQQGAADTPYPTTTYAPAPSDETAQAAPDEAAKVAPAAGSTQVAGQSADNEQTADADATATQIEPTNESIAVRVLSPGDDGPVTQSNDSIALAGALNGNSTTQDLGQNQGGPGSSGKQIAGQSAKNDQSADADASSKQIAPSNTYISVRILSPGDDGPVTQSNTNVAGALAANGNATDQSVGQSQGGSGGGTQIAGQKADNKQNAEADAEAVQVHPTNTNISVRILSPGSNGPVSQSNTNVAGALAGNLNITCQCIIQNLPGGPGGSSTQIAGQSASSEQDAEADADATQIEPRNENLSARVLSPGADGPVSQSNTSLALAGALNANATQQCAEQSQSGSGKGTQVAGQKATSDQDATADADAEQIEPANLNAPVRVLSPDDKHSGSGSAPVEQSNSTLAGSLAANWNRTGQAIGQRAGGSGGLSVQAAGQLADNEQTADADADATQCCASNVNAPVAVKSHGTGGGPVRQSNDVAALAGALNLNATEQSIAQSQSGSGGTAIQAAGQKASNDQDADADADALQVHPSNVNAGLRVLDPRDQCDESCKEHGDGTSSPKRDTRDNCDESCREHDDKWLPKRDTRDRCDESCEEHGDDTWSPKRDRSEPWDGCALRNRRLHEDGCASRMPAKPEYRCKGDEPRKRLDTCPRDRCKWKTERKDPCTRYPAPRAHDRRPMPMV